MQSEQKQPVWMMEVEEEEEEEEEEGDELHLTDVSGAQVLLA